MCLRYILAASSASALRAFFCRRLMVRRRWPTCSPTRKSRRRARRGAAGQCAARRPAAAASRSSEVVGQEHLTGPDGAIGRMVAAGRLASMILWGPPGTGKTSIARLLADAVGLRFVAISAVFSGVADLKKIFAEARTAARAGPADLAVRRRDPPLQSRAAGRLPALCRGRHGDAGRRDDREPELRDQRRAAVALPGADPAAGSTTRRSRNWSAAPRRSRTGRFRSPPRPARR